MSELPAAPSRLARAASGVVPVGGLRALVAAVAAVLLAAGAGLVYATGGTRHAWVHVLYVPVLLAAWGYGAVGGVAAGVLAGLAVGPWMPVDVAAGLSQEPANWLSRTGFFVLIGGLAGGLNQLLRAQLDAADRVRQQFAEMVEHAPDVLIVCNRDGQVRYASPAVSAVLSQDPDALAGSPITDLVHTDDQPAAGKLLAAGAGRHEPAELRMRHRDGSWRLVELRASALSVHSADAVVLNGRDVTARRAMEAELRHQAWHDEATGLANRRKATDVVGAALASRTATGMGVLMLSLDPSQTLAGALGPDSRDRLVAAVGRRLQALLGPGQLLARYDVCELAVIAADVGDAATATELAQQLLAACETPFMLGEGQLYVRARAGVVIAGPADTDPAELLGDALTAAQQSDEPRTSAVAVFRPEWRQAARAALDTETALHHALDRGELELHYQPVINLRTGHATALEALLRWRHPRRGLIGPADFVPLAEQTGTIVPIGRWVLQQACADLAALRRDLQAPQLRMAVNLSARQLETAALADDVRDALHDADLTADALTLELTESTLFDHTGHTLEALIALRGLGVRLAVDDFGTGYSSMGYLKRLPVDMLKIDRAFVQHLPDDRDDEAIVTATVGLAHSLGLDTIAEGVESDEHARRLIALGCDHAQGYHYAQPQPLADTHATLAGLIPARPLARTATSNR